MGSQLLMRRPRLDDLPEVPPLPREYQIRPLALDEEDSLARLLLRAFPDSDWTPQRARARISRAPGVEAVYVAVRARILVGTASVRLLPEEFPGSGYLHWLGVDPDHRGRGLGGGLTVTVLRHFALLGCRDAVLHTDDFRAEAIRLYLRMGFVPEMDDETHPARWAAVMGD
jgi:mycothiol synthase